jgi:hypothetical protein
MSSIPNQWLLDDESGAVYATPADLAAYATISSLDAHADATVLDHPDGSVTEPKLDIANSWSAGFYMGMDGAGRFQWSLPPATLPSGSDTQVQYNNAGNFGSSPNLTFNSTTGFLSSRGLNVNPSFSQLRNFNDGGIQVRQATVFSAFRTDAVGSATGADNGVYADITDTVNGGVFNVFNGTTLYRRVYFGWDTCLPRQMFSYNNSGASGVTGVVLWEIWNGSAWVTITGNNLTADGGSVTIPTTATSKTAINGVSAFWIRATVSTAYTVAPQFRFIRSSTASNLSGSANTANYMNGIFIAPSSTTQSLINTAMSAGANGAMLSGFSYGNGDQPIMQIFSSGSGNSLFLIGGDGTITAGSADNTFRNLTLNGGVSNQSSTLTLVNGSKSQTSWLIQGAFFRSQAGTRTNSSVAGTYATAVFNSFNTPTLAATNAGTITTDAATVYIEAAPIQGTNQTLTNRWALWVDSGNVRFDGALRVDQRIASGVSVLTDAATIAVDASLGNHFRVTLAGNRTLGVPTNLVDGQRFTIEFIQDGVGSRTLTHTTGSADSYQFGTDIPSVTLSTTAGATDIVEYIYSSTKARCLVIDVKKGY